MSKEIKVSVICLTYNHEKYIRQCLEGFVFQKTNFSFEVIVHDDASTDNTAKIIKEYEQKYPNIIKPIYEKENQYSKKIGIIRNVIFPLTRGKYLAFCEGDDFWISPDKLQKQYDALEKNPNCGMCVCKVKCVDEDGETPYNLEFPPNEEMFNKTKVFNQNEMAKMLLGKKNPYPFHTSSYFVLKSVYKENDPKKWNAKSRDYEYLKASLAYGDFYYINEHLSTRRKNAIGSWNERMKKVNNSWIILRRNDAVADLEFCKFLKGKYQNLIYPSAFNTLYSSISIDIFGTAKLLKQYNLSYCKYSNYKSVYGYIRAFILLKVSLIFPGFADWYVKYFESKVIPRVKKLNTKSVRANKTNNYKNNEN